MNLIEFFGTIIKPKICKGKYMFAPINNEKIGENIYALRDKDVNVFLYEKENIIIAIDCGYKNSGNISKAMDYFNLDENDIFHLFVTHLDLYHAGGIDKRCKRIFKNAKIYIGNIEIKYAENKLNRKKIAFIGLKSPIKLSDGYIILENMQIEYIGKIKIQAILIPSHTLGHLCYLIDDKYLFTGDSIILVKGKGYCFYNQWNVNSKLNMESLTKLKTLEDIKLVITSHSGYTENITDAFSNINELPSWKDKNYKVNDNALYNPYE
jgi:glyoxylase-like metal-dependent hydrolase (beta-lactamase superfamily II)